MNWDKPMSMPVFSVLVIVSAVALALPIWGFRANLAAGMARNDAMRCCLAPVIKTISR